MIPLTTTTETLQIVVSANADVTVSGYQDGTSPPTFKQVTAATTGAARTICSAIATVAVPKNVSHITARTTGGANTVVVQGFDSSGSVTTTQVGAVLAANETLEYTHAAGWRVLDANGAVKYVIAGAVAATTLAVSGDSTLTGDLAVNGGDLTTTATTFNLLETNATTVNAFGAASVALNIGNASAAAAFPGGVSIPNGKSLTLVGTANLGGSGTATISGFSTSSVGALTATTGAFSDTVLMHKNINGVARFTARNDTSGTAAQAQIGAQLVNFTAYNLLGVASAGYTSAGLTVANGAYLVSSGNSAGLNLFTQDNTQLTLGTNDVARLSITGTGAVTIPGTTVNMTTSGTTLTVGVGADNGTVSAGVFTDRTKAFVGDAVGTLRLVKSKGGHIDHATLPAFACADVRKSTTDAGGKITETVEVERDLGAMVSVLTVAVQELDARLAKIEK